MKRPYFVEWFALANLVVIAIATRGHDYVRPRPIIVLGLVITILVQVVLGIAVRLAVELVRRRRGYLRRIRTRAWLIETLRLSVAIALTFYTYGWIKLSMPVLHPVLFDQQLWDLDQLLFFGAAPTILVLDLFGNETFLWSIDFSYSIIFFVSTWLASAFFVSDPRSRLRIAFVNGNATLWLVGAWLYMAVPSLGPAYAFHDVWMQYQDVFPRSQYLQALLMRNYQNILRAMRGEPHGSIEIMYGIAAFPSLHVAFQTYVFLWMRRVWTSGEVLFGIFAAAIFLGSMITGWHYFVDAIAGLALAILCWWIFWRRARMTRFLRLF